MAFNKSFDMSSNSITIEYNYKQGKEEGERIGEKCWDKFGNEIECK